MSLLPTDNELFYQVLILEADSQQAGTILKVLAQRNLRGTVATTPISARKLLDRACWNLVFLSSDFPHAEGQGDSFWVLNRIRSLSPELPVVMVDSKDSARTAIKALEQGCVDFIPNDPDAAAIEQILDAYLPNHSTRAAAMIALDDQKTYPIVGGSEVLKKLIRMARSVAPTAAPVLISGPSGTGKELIARLIHNESRRCEGAFIQVNCAALSESLLESELFGHEKGAFTGAVVSRQGCLERAHGGTLLLDEITETPPAFQAKLLRALEQMQFERVGGQDNIRVNVRVISTTNQDIHKLVQEGQFRADLYYRLAAVRLQMSSLNERIEDLPDLVWWFINQFAAEAGRVITEISPETLRLFECSCWPGNIRQLRNTIRTAMILGQGPVLCVTGLPWILEELLGDSARASDPRTFDLGRTSLRELERRAILATLDETEGNQTRAAEVLGISDRTLRDKVKKYRQHDYVAISS
jgi:DNA-binding NtrC family response regulator